MTTTRSLKRPCDGEAEEDSNKNPRLCDDARNVMLKMLCPNDVAGSVIGRGGSNLATLRSSGGTIHISKNGECYPDHLDRVIVMTGSISTVLSMTDNIVKLLFEVCLARPCLDHCISASIESRTAKCLFPTASGCCWRSHWEKRCTAEEYEGEVSMQDYAATTGLCS